MKIKKLIEKLQDILNEKGNVEVFLADSYISCNHQYGQIKDFKFYKHWYETGRGDKEGILLGQEDPYDSVSPDIEDDDENEKD